MTISQVDFIAGMAKGMAVLESFGTDRQRLNATLAAERTGLTRAAARRHLLTLAHLGYLETEAGYFWLSSKVLRFSGSYLASARLPRVLQPTLNRLALRAQASFSAVVLDGESLGRRPREAHLARADRLFVFRGQQEAALRHAVDPSWRGVTPWVALIGADGAVTFGGGTPTRDRLETWARGEGMR